jgi:hypothetical protein
MIRTNKVTDGFIDLDQTVSGPSDELLSSPFGTSAITFINARDC